MSDDPTDEDMLRALVQAAPAVEWYACTWDPMEQPHISRVDGHHHPHDDLARNMSKADAELAAAAVNYVRGKFG